MPYLQCISNSNRIPICSIASKYESMFFNEKWKIDCVEGTGMGMVTNYKSQIQSKLRCAVMLNGRESKSKSVVLYGMVWYHNQKRMNEWYQMKDMNRNEINRNRIKCLCQPPVSLGGSRKIKSSHQIKSARAMLEQVTR